MTSSNKPTFASIVIPIDGSALSETAIPLAVAIGGGSGSRINLVTVVLSHSIPLNEQIDELTRRTLKHAHDELKIRFPGVTQTVLAGDPATEIAKHAMSIDADLIVMATHGRTGLRKFILGSVADRLLTESNVPILLAHGDEKGPGALAEAAMVNRVIVPIDGTEPTKIAIPYALEVARITGADTTLVHVRENGGSGSGESQLGQVAREYSVEGLPVSTEMLEGKPGEAISLIASDVPGTVVVMASISATGAGRGAHRGSVADHVVKHSTAAVLIVPPRGLLGSVVE